MTAHVVLYPSSISVCVSTCDSVLYLLLFYILVTSKGVWVWVPTCYSAYPWRLYSVVSLWGYATSTTKWYLTQSHYPIIEPTSWIPYPNNAEHQPSDKHTFLSHWFGTTRVLSHCFEYSNIQKWETQIQLFWQSRLVQSRHYLYIKSVHFPRNKWNLHRRNESAKLVYYDLKNWHYLHYVS